MYPWFVNRLADDWRETGYVRGILLDPSLVSRGIDGTVSTATRWRRTITYDSAKDPEVRKLAKAALDWLYFGDPFLAGRPAGR
jgi:hypothetical protein